MTNNGYHEPAGPVRPTVCPRCGSTDPAVRRNAGLIRTCMDDWHDRPTDDLPFGPGHPEWCPVGKPEADEAHMHCSCWWECEPCCRCGDDTPDPHCDCDRCTEARTT